MKTIIFSLLFIISFSAKSQFTDSLEMPFTEKGRGTTRDIIISVKSGITNKKTTIYSYYSWPGNNLRDTIYYEMEEGDTVKVSLSLTDNFNGIYNFKFDLQFIYGVPVMDTSYSYEYNGSNFITRAVIADSACFTFCYDGKGVKSHYVKLTKKKKNIPDETIYSKVSVYPNPTSEALNIELNSNLETNFLLVNAEGRIVRQWNKNESHRKDLSDLENGIYLLQVSDENESYTVKINIISN